MKAILIALAAAAMALLNSCSASGQASGWSAQAGGIQGSGTIRER